MMKNVDDVYRYGDPLIHQYNMTAARLHVEDVTERPFVYCFDVFIRYTNPRHVNAFDTLFVSITTSSVFFVTPLLNSP